MGVKDILVFQVLLASHLDDSTDGKHLVQTLL